MSIAEDVRVLDRLRSRQVATRERLYEINGEPSELILEKHTTYLTPLLEEFIMAAPFFMIATSDAAGNCDVSPKGDPASSVRILDARTLVVPDRPGNRRVDGHRNILENPHIGLIFVVPAVEETVRVNGRAFLTDDPELLESMQVQGKTPKLATVVEVDEAYVHCSRSFLRAGLWKAETWPDPDTIPTIGAMMAEQKGWEPPDESQGKRQEEYRKHLY
ncbi:MAG: pyridoxamine 5'-phosphate oxidase family protein [Thermomicrobiales bacterium]|nr:pyridoxamine 5'-phosphate oxidase family protein [Thermomicrobiales bacterium]